MELFVKDLMGKSANFTLMPNYSSPVAETALTTNYRTIFVSGKLQYVMLKMKS